jgi:hypothetical protein
MNIQHKGVDTVVMRNNNRFIFTSNDNMPVKVTEDNRRYVIFRCSDEKKGDYKYFNALTEYFENPNNQRAIYDYLLNFDIAGTHWVDEAPQTEQTDYIKGACADPLLKFIENVYTTCKYNAGTKYPENIADITCTEFIEKYHLYCVSQLNMKDFKRPTGAQLGMLMKRDFIASPTNPSGIFMKRVGHAKITTYRLDLVQLETFLKSKCMLRQDTLDHTIGYCFEDEDDNIELGAAKEVYDPIDGTVLVERQC